MSKGIFILECYDMDGEVSLGYVTTSYMTIGDMTRAKPYFFDSSKDIEELTAMSMKTLDRALNPRVQGPLRELYNAVREKFFKYYHIDELSLVAHIQQDPKPAVD